MVKQEMRKGVFYVHRTPRYTYFGIHPESPKGGDLDPKRTKEKLSMLLGWRDDSRLRDCHSRFNNPIKGALWWEVVGDVKIRKKPKVVDGKMADFSKLFIDMDAKAKPAPASKVKSEPAKVEVIDEDDGFTAEDDEDDDIEIEDGDEEEEEEEEEEVPTPTPTPTPEPAPIKEPILPEVMPDNQAQIFLAKAREITRKDGIKEPLKSYWEVILAQSMMNQALVDANTALCMEVNHLRADVRLMRIDLKELLKEWRS